MIKILFQDRVCQWFAKSISNLFKLEVSDHCWNKGLVEDFVYFLIINNASVYYYFTAIVIGLIFIAINGIRMFSRIARLKTYLRYIRRNKYLYTLRAKN